MTEFSALMRQLTQPGADGSPGVTVSEDWLQGRTVYGGLSAALCLQAAMQTLPDLPPLRSAQLAFIGPATGELKPKACELRRGKSAVYVSVDCTGDLGLATRALFCFGVARPVAHTHLGLKAPQVAPPAQSANFFTPGVAPKHTKYFDGQFAGGEMLFTGGKNPTMTLWLRHRDPVTRAATGNDAMVALLALADAPPPAAFVLYDKFVPISTMTWQIDMLTDDLSTDDGWWLMTTQAESASLGYSGQAMTIWNATGRPVAAARQTVAVFG